MFKRRIKVLYIDDNILYAEAGNRLVISHDFGESWNNLSLGFPLGMRAYSRLHARLLRSGIHRVEMVKNGKMVAIGKNGIYEYERARGLLNRTFRMRRGSRPLSICGTQDGALFWGEYFRNPKRDEVNIYGSSDEGRSWSIVHTFGKGEIRHVHGVFCDPHDGNIWITTGDDDRESAIWMTRNRFESLEKVMGGSQQSRALQLIFTEEYVYFGTDTPFEENHIFRISRDTGKKEKLCCIDGSVYWGCKAGGWIFFSTAVEPSTVNTCGEAAIWGSPDGKAWRRVLGFKKDPWSAKYFQIGQILFPEGENRTPYLFYTPFATDGDQTLRRVRIDSLM